MFLFTLPGEFYKKLKESDKGKDFELIFVSSDRDQQSFDDYYGTMPFLALKHELRTKQVRTHTYRSTISPTSSLLGVRRFAP